jgi:hypothetical protein
MTASPHINGTGSAVVDSILVCRHVGDNGKAKRVELRRWLTKDAYQLATAGLSVTNGDLTCLSLGHSHGSRSTRSAATGDASRSVEEKMHKAEIQLRKYIDQSNINSLADEVLLLPRVDGPGKTTQPETSSRRR